MTTRILILLTTLLPMATMAESARAFLNSPVFDELCEKTMRKTPPFEALGQTWSTIYTIRRPSFAEGSESVFVALREEPYEGGSYVIASHGKVFPHDRTLLFRSSEPVVGLILEGDSLFALTHHSLLKWSLTEQRLTTFQISEPRAEDPFDRAFALIAQANRVWVAHGTGGLKVLDSGSGELIAQNLLGLNQSNGHRSLAASLLQLSNGQTLVGVTARTVSTSHSRPFEGFVLMNANAQILGRYPMKVSHSGILARPHSLRKDGDRIWVNNSGTLQYFSLADMKKRGEVVIGWIPTLLTQGQKRFHAEPLGDFWIFGSQVYACAKLNQLQTTKPHDKKGIALRLPFSVEQPKVQVAGEELSVRLFWLEGPYSSPMQTSRLRIELTDSNGNLKSLPENMRLELQARMPSMDHEAMEPGYFEVFSLGTYDNNNLVLGMGGDWSFNIMVVNKDHEVISTVKLEEYL